MLVLSRTRDESIIIGDNVVVTVVDVRGDKVKLGIYLHQNLCRVATRCVGVDTNAEGVQLLHELGFPEVFLPDDTPVHS